MKYTTYLVHDYLICNKMLVSDIGRFGQFGQPGQPGQPLLRHGWEICDV